MFWLALLANIVGVILLMAWAYRTGFIGGFVDALVIGTQAQVIDKAGASKIIDFLHARAKRHEDEMREG